MSSFGKCVIKYSRPTQFDQADYGTIWQAELSEDTENFIQTSEDRIHPKWVALGDVLETALINNARPEEWEDYLRRHAHAIDINEHICK